MSTEYEVAAGGPLVIGATGITEILQNVRVILTTLKTTVPLDRDFGVAGAVIDQPLPIARARMMADIVTEVEKQEPRVRVSSVSWSGDSQTAMDGTMSPVVRVVLRDGVEL